MQAFIDVPAVTRGLITRYHWFTVSQNLSFFFTHTGSLSKEKIFCVPIGRHNNFVRFAHTVAFWLVLWPVCVVTRTSGHGFCGANFTWIRWACRGCAPRACSTKPESCEWMREQLYFSRQWIPVSSWGERKVIKGSFIGKHELQSLFGKHHDLLSFLSRCLIATFLQRRHGAFFALLRTIPKHDRPKSSSPLPSRKRRNAQHVVHQRTSNASLPRCLSVRLVANVARLQRQRLLVLLHGRGLQWHLARGGIGAGELHGGRNGVAWHGSLPMWRPGGRSV